MTYQDIGHLFFPLYLGGSLLACLCSCGMGWRRHLWVAFVFGIYAVLLFQLRFDGQAHALGLAWYGVVAFVQVVVLVVARVMRVRAWKIIGITAAAAILLNAAYAASAALDHPMPRQGFFVGVNLVQCLQLGSLIVLAPVWPFLTGVWRRLITRKMSWQPSKQSLPPHQRAAISGTR